MVTMQYDELLAQMTPEIYQRLKQAVELGKWPDGRALTKEQKANCMEAVLRYQSIHLPAEEQAGFMSDTCASAKVSPAQVLKIN